MVGSDIMLKSVPLLEMIIEFTLPSCDLCFCNIETIIHLHVFWECPLNQVVWNSLKSFVQEKGIIIELTVTNVLFGTNLKNH